MLITTVEKIDTYAPIVEIKTTAGDIKIQLHPETPKHRDNFIKLVKESFYDNILFHRIIKNFMMQAGDPDSINASMNTHLGAGGPDYTIEAELNTPYFHMRGAVAAARLGDAMNPEKASSGSQFYIVYGKQVIDKELDSLERNYGFKFTPEQREAYKTVGGTPFLDGEYTVFGQVIEGMDVLKEINKVATNREDRPLEDVKIISMTILEEA